MENKMETPIEEKSYSLLYFVFAAILLFATVWAIWDETVTRRPWKSYQSQFYEIQTEKVKAEYEEAVQNIQSDYEERKTQLTAAKKGFNSPGNQKKYKHALRQLDKSQMELDEINQKYRFVNSEFDAINYRYEKALKEGNQAEEKKKRVQMDKLEEKKNDLLNKIKKVAKNRDKEKEAVKQFTAKMDELQDEVSVLAADMNRLQKKIDATKSKSPEIKQIVISGFDKGSFDNRLARVDRCTTCHMGINDSSFADAQQPFTSHPPQLLSDHPESKFGCTTCHGGQGQALTINTAHGDVQYWEHPLMKGDNIQSSCRKCHDSVIDLPEAPLLSKGKKLFMDLGCSGCHEVKEYENLQKVGVSLNRLSHKVDKNWLHKWLKNPKDYLPKAKMPTFLLKDSEAESMAAYLMNIYSKEDFNLQEKYQGNGSPRNGEKLVFEVGCLGCHTVEDQGHPFASDLTRIGGKVNEDWLLDWLKNPTHYEPDSQMPSLGLSDVEAVDVVAYLMTLKGEEGKGARGQEGKKARGQEGISLDSTEKIKEGEKLVRTYGCFGCHDIKDMERESKVGVELSNFGSKTVEELDFGHAFKVEESWYGWTVAKLEDSRKFVTERSVPKMPDFSLSSEDAHALAIFLRSLAEEDIPEQYVRKLSDSEASVEQGRRVLDKFNCAGCHEIEGKGSDISASIAQMLEKEGKTEEEIKAFMPPSLDGEGKKVQQDWLFTFLKNPTVIRPWLRTRMPAFNNLSDDEATTLVKYFSVQSDEKFPYEFVAAEEVPEAQLQVGKQIFDLLKCVSCHPSQGEKLSEIDMAELAPDLSLAKERLKPDWLIEWMRDPLSLQKGTKMPMNWVKIGGKYYLPPMLQQILDGDAEKQMEAVKDFMLTLGD